MPKSVLYMVLICGAVVVFELTHSHTRYRFDSAVPRSLHPSVQNSPMYVLMMVQQSTWLSRVVHRRNRAMLGTKEKTPNSQRVCLR